MSRSAVFLMYHELETPHSKLCEDSAGYRRYVVRENDFHSQLSLIKQSGRRGLSVSEALDSLDRDEAQAKTSVCFTFDDGCASDLRVAAPLLREAGFGATFYVTYEHLGRFGYLTKKQLRELRSLGFEIGSHSMTHRHLNDLGLDDVRRELADSKRCLEELIGASVVHFSCPGGRVNELVTAVAKEAGYESVATSQIGVNNKSSSRFALKRTAVKRDMSKGTFGRVSDGKGQLLRRSEDTVLTISKKILGNERYDRLRSSLLSLAHRVDTPAGK